MISIESNFTKTFYKMEKVEILDCTFRDGGYYNNWEFKHNDVQKYINYLNKTNIKYIEIGMRFVDEEKSYGLTGKTPDAFLKKLKKGSIKLGVMINASDYLFNNKVKIQLLKKNFKSFKYINFIRIACKANEIREISSLIKFFRSKTKLMINLMQITEVNLKELNEIIFFLKKKKITNIYIADSLGSLNIFQLKKICRELIKFNDIKFGIHAHNNLNFALKNSLYAIKNKFSFVDSTFMGMGRGAGNTKTEEIYNCLYPADKNGNDHIKIIKNQIFKNLHKKYKWGTNKFYKYAAINKIHPTYVQELIKSRNRNAQQILKNLAKLDSTRYNFDTLNSFNKKISSNFYPEFGKKVIILGSNPNLITKFNKIEKISKKENIKLLSLNYNNGFLIKQKFKINIDYIISCSLKRILTEFNKYHTLNANLILPIKKLPKKIVQFLKNKKIKFYDYDFAKSNIYKTVSKNKCFLKNELTLAYAILLLISFNVKEIILVGFEKNRKELRRIDQTSDFLKYINKKIHQYNIKLDHL
jgi:4-hydroxy 2-oxovalerate aldolase